MTSGCLAYVITGCAASGTAWAAEVMTRLGSNCGHECLYGGSKSRGCDQDNEGESSWMVAPHLDQLDAVTMLLIRNPLLVVRSLLRMQMMTNPEYWSNIYLREHASDLVDDDPFTTTLRYVAQWDADVDADLVLRVDKGPSAMIVHCFESLTDRKPSGNVRAALADIGTKVNTHNGSRSRVAWSDIANHSEGAPVIAKAKRWGYL